MRVFLCIIRWLIYHIIFWNNNKIPSPRSSRVSPNRVQHLNCLQIQIFCRLSVRSHFEQIFSLTYINIYISSQMHVAQRIVHFKVYTEPPGCTPLWPEQFSLVPSSTTALIHAIGSLSFGPKRFRLIFVDFLAELYNPRRNLSYYWFLSLPRMALVSDLGAIPKI